MRKKRKLTKEHREKLSISRKKYLIGHPESGFQKNNKESGNWIGRKHRSETKEKIRDSMRIKNPMFEKHVRNKVSKTRKDNGVSKGQNNPNWKGGITTVNKSIRETDESREWRSSVFERDNYTCRQCGKRSKESDPLYIEAHHIKPFSIIVSEHKIISVEDSFLCDPLWDINNGMTLCKKCHCKKPKGREIYNIKSL